MFYNFGWRKKRVLTFSSGYFNIAALCIYPKICLAIESIYISPQGHATSFFSPALERYSSFQVHAANDIRQIQSMENGVGFLTKNNLKYTTRGGLIIFDYLWVISFLAVTVTSYTTSHNIRLVHVACWTSISSSTAVGSDHFSFFFLCVSPPVCVNYILFLIFLNRKPNYHACFFRMDETVDNHSLLLMDSNTLLMAGMQNHVIQMDLNTVQETQRVIIIFASCCAIAPNKTWKVSLQNIFTKK